MLTPTKNNGTYTCGDLTLRVTSTKNPAHLKATVLRGEEVVDTTLVETMGQAVKKLRRCANGQ